MDPNVAVVFGIIQSALNILQLYTSGPIAEKDLQLAQLLTDIARSSILAYEQHMGEPIDENSIKPA